MGKRAHADSSSVELTFEHPEPLIRACKDLPFLKNLPSLSPASLELLLIFYQNMRGSYKNEFDSRSSPHSMSVKAPLILSFHPKISLLNNNVHECLFASLLAHELDLVPVWVPFMYDTATHSAAEGGKIRAPTYVFIENEFIQLRSVAQIRGNIVKTEKPISKSELDRFFQSLQTHLLNKFNEFKNQMDPFDFGHPLFELKQKMVKFDPTHLMTHLDHLKGLMLDALHETLNLGESLSAISQVLLKEFGIDFNLCFLERSLPVLVERVFTVICNKPDVIHNPGLLDGLFIFYNLKTKVRSPIKYTGQDFVSIDSDNKQVFSGKLTDLCLGLKQNKILPSGMTLILMFNALGCPITFGGPHTQRYYPQYIQKSQKLLENTSYMHNMNVLGYGNLRAFDVRNLTDIMAVARVLDKVGSRVMIKNGQIALPHDIVDQINFIAGLSALPMEYTSIAKHICANDNENSNIISRSLSSSPNIDTIKPCPTALEREQRRFEQISVWNKLPLNQLRYEINEMKPFFPTLNLEQQSNDRLKFLVENLLDDSNLRVKRLKENLQMDQHLLGGRLAKSPTPEPLVSPTKETGNLVDFEELYDGILIRSKRVSTLLELVVYKISLQMPFLSPLRIKKSMIPCFPYLLLPENESEFVFSLEHPLIFTKFDDIFSRLIPQSYLPHFLK